MQVAITGIKTIKTCHATRDITPITPRIRMIENAKDPMRAGMLKSTALWSVDALKNKSKLVKQILLGMVLVFTKLLRDSNVDSLIKFIRQERTLLIIRPLGVASKKDMGARKMQ